MGERVQGGDLHQLLLKPYFTHLNHRSNVSVLRDVTLENICIGQKGVCERLDGLTGEPADGGERRRLVRSSAEHTDFNRNSLNGGAEQAECERHVRVEVVVHIEVAVRFARVEDGDFDHTPTIDASPPRTATKGLKWTKWIWLPKPPAGECTWSELGNKRC